MSHPRLDCEKRPSYSSCGQYIGTEEPGEWCRNCLINETRRLVSVEKAAEAFILSKRGWEPWGGGHFLYDRTGGHGEGRVFSLEDALEHLANQVRRQRRR